MFIYTPTAKFKASIRTQKRGPADKCFLRKTTVSTPASQGGRSIKFTISTGAVDRDCDTINQKGWDLKTFLQNPTVFFNHSTDQLPIAKCTWLGLEQDKLKGVAEFVPADMPFVGDLAEAIFRMCKTGFLSATSVGFIPTEFDVARNRDTGNAYLPPVDFKKQQLVEWSIVGIPANAEALIEPGQRDTVTSALDSTKRGQMTPEQKRELSAKFERHRRLARIM